MDVSSLGSSVSAPRPAAESSTETADTAQSASNTTQGQVSQEAQTSAVPPVQASSDLGGEEGSVVSQDNSASANAQSSEPGSGAQVDIVA
ncbi:MAG TPA: hypothetical protein HPP54_07850 [Nitrospinae bacterium]|nr:hypothetical protein [Nitrospinota bacterium]